MHLKNLHILGFKSFADKTNIDFVKGVTAIVGPNGCGKSNVSDAIRWVLGEQSAKALRGGEMADVIFNGTDSRKQLGMAEVSLTFEGCKDVLKTGQIAGADTNFDEVTVSRRIFRDGNSEYFINKTPCRLKDVQSLFMDTGIGRSSYSIMEQGKIDKILSAHPEDRRSIFEEAAGITKFKSQKKEALRKLEYTDSNLLRVADIIREVKRQIGSLQRQVSKARRYQAILAEVKQLDTQLGRYEYQQILDVTQKLEADITEFKSRIEDVRLEIDTGEGAVTNLRQQISTLEAKRQGTLQSQRDVQSDIERQETRIKVNTDRIAETGSMIENSEKEISESRVRSVEIQNKLGQIRESLEGARQKLEQQKAEFEGARSAYDEAEKLEREHSQILKGLQAKLLSLEGSLANLRNQANMLEKQKTDYSLRIQKISSEKVIAVDEKQKLVQRLESLQTEISSFKLTFQASRDAVTGGEERLAELENQCQFLTTRITEEQRKLSEKVSRRDVLRQLQQSYEGYSEGARAILKQVSETPAEGVNSQAVKDQVLGSLANLIHVEPKFTGAIEAVLGQKLESIVVADINGALNFVTQLKNRELGRALFAIQQELGQNSNISYQREPLQGSLRWASEVVRAEPPVESLLKRLLADTVIVNDLHQAIEFRKENPGLTLVTLEGDILDHYGILTAGSSRCTSLQLIGQRNEIAGLEEEITKIEAQLHELSTQKGESEGHRALARQSLGNRQSDLRFQENDLTKKEALLGVLQNEVVDFDKKISTADLEIQELERSLKETEENQVRIRQDLVQAESTQVTAVEESAAANLKSEELVQRRNELSSKANDSRIAYVTAQQQIQSMESQVQPLERQAAECSQFIANRENEVRSARQRIVQWEGENAESIQLIQSQQSVAAGFAEQISKLDEEKAQVEREVNAAVETVRTHRQKLEDIQSELGNLEVRLTEKKGDRNHLVERISREYQVDISTLNLMTLEELMHIDYAMADEKSEEPSESEKSESAEAVPEATEQPTEEVKEKKERARKPKVNFASWDDVAMRVAELRAKLQSMGPVNLEAVQEFEELEQRYQFLTREHDDLVLSKEQLQEIIKKINTTTKTMFAETFAKIQENFRAIYVELFGGGKADLLLADDTDPLECGIEIVAKPPGKQLQSILLLSGGEKTMTAVALLFAIYMVKPSPFCVLDEMDAPLDESNINRFIKMLERFLQYSQFVIITHNKRTIGMADALYGVTMEERGVSKLVSVKFHKKNEASSGQQQQPKQEAGKGKLLVDVPSLP